MSVFTLRDAQLQERGSGFIHYFTALQKDAAETNRKNGFNDPDTLALAVGGEVGEALKQARAGLKLALIMGELGETLEAVRKNLGPDSHIPDFTAEEAELADVFIRGMNYAHDRGLRLAEAILAKNEFNRNREDHSKEERAAEHGKRF